MDKADIQAFLAVAQNGTISKAAEKLYISHSTLSWRINKLEEEFGAELFMRGKGLKRVELTKAGNSFLPYAYRLLETWQEAASAIGKAAESSLSIVIGHNHNLLFNNAYKEFSTKYPKIPLYLLLRHSADAYGFVKSGEMDAGFVAVEHQSADIRAISLCRERFVLVCGSRSWLSVADKADIEGLNTENEIKWWVSPSGIADWQMKWFGKEPKWVVQDDPYTMETLLENSDLWTVLPASTAQTFTAHNRDGITVRELGIECPHRDIFLIMRKSATPSEALKNFLKILREDFESKGIEWLCDEL